MKQSLTIAVTLAAMLLCGCKNERDGLLVPSVKYEFGGGAGHYDYAPSFIRDDNGIIYGFLCENRDPFRVIDYIYLYKGIPTKKGIEWQPGTLILGPSEDGWDKKHTCDPDVREFKTKWKGEEYNWIMTYLGVEQGSCNHNQIGLAVAKCIEGPYIKYDGNPIVPYEGMDKWGVGQSTSIVKNDSTIVLYYSSTTKNGRFCRREIILNDLDNLRVGEEQNVPFMSANSYPAILGDKMYIVSEHRDSTWQKVDPVVVGNTCRLCCKTIDDDAATDENPWSIIGWIKPEDSGFQRNHNPGFLTDTKGYIPDNDKLVVYFTTAVLGPDWLWSYDLRSATFKLNM